MSSEGWLVQSFSIVIPWRESSLWKEIGMDRLARFQRIPDPRSRRLYPWHGWLAILVLAAAHQENSLRSMGQWAKERAEILLNFPPLDLWSNHDFPSYGTFWYLLTKLGVGELEQALRGWGRREERLALDGKVLRGSKRGHGSLEHDIFYI